MVKTFFCALTILFSSGCPPTVRIDSLACIKEPIKSNIKNAQWLTSCIGFLNHHNINNSFIYNFLVQYVWKNSAPHTRVITLCLEEKLLVRLQNTAKVSFMALAKASASVEGILEKETMCLFSPTFTSTVFNSNIYNCIQHCSYTFDQNYNIIVIEV